MTNSPDYKRAIQANNEMITELEQLNNRLTKEIKGYADALKKARGKGWEKNEYESYFYGYCRPTHEKYVAINSIIKTGIVKLKEQIKKYEQQLQLQQV